MSAGAAAAKVVSHSPMRPELGQSLKNTLDTPFRVKWPSLSEATISQVKTELERSLSDMKCLYKRTRQEAKRKGTVIENKDGDKPPPQTSEGDFSDTSRITTTTEEQKSVEVSSSSTPPAILPGEESEKTLAKKSQLVIGLNAVTRLLEKGLLLAGLVSSSSPFLLHQHLLPLVASRGVPFMAVPELEETAGKLLGIKRVLCLGLKKLPDDTDHFPALTRTIADCAPPVSIPWLLPPTTQIATPSDQKEQLSAEGTEGSGTGGDGGIVYCPLHIKRTKIVANKKRKRKKKK